MDVHFTYRVGKDLVWMSPLYKVVVHGEMNCIDCTVAVHNMNQLSHRTVNAGQGIPNPNITVVAFSTMNMRIK